jgi:hypothetical protein
VRARRRCAGTPRPWPAPRAGSRRTTGRASAPPRTRPRPPDARPARAAPPPAARRRAPRRAPGAARPARRPPRHRHPREAQQGFRETELRFRVVGTRPCRLAIDVDRLRIARAAARARASTTRSWAARAGGGPARSAAWQAATGSASPPGDRHALTGPRAGASASASARSAGSTIRTLPC